MTWEVGKKKLYENNNLEMITGERARNRSKTQEKPGIQTLHYAAQTVAAWYMIGGYNMQGGLWVFPDTALLQHD
jgi:hypothetical protein